MYVCMCVCLQDLKYMYVCMLSSDNLGNSFTICTVGASMYNAECILILNVCMYVCMYVCKSKEGRKG